MGNLHLSLNGEITSLFAPEIVLHGSVAQGAEAAEGKVIAVSGSIRGQQVRVIQASGCVPDPSGTAVTLQADEFDLILAWEDDEGQSKFAQGWAGLRSLVAGLFPFDSTEIRLGFSGRDVEVTASVHLKIPHALTRYYADTRNLQHVFDERKQHGRRPPSYMGGVCSQGDEFALHLHYKALDAARRIAGPALTMISVLLLDLAIVLAAGSVAVVPSGAIGSAGSLVKDVGDVALGSWRQSPVVLLGVLGVNIGALAGIAAIRAGSTQRSLLNLVRLSATAWIIGITVMLRFEIDGVAATLATCFVDWGLKAAGLWAICVSVFAFTAYSLVRSPSDRARWFLRFSLVALALWVLSVVLLPQFQAAELFGRLIRS